MLTDISQDVAGISSEAFCLLITTNLVQVAQVSSAAFLVLQKLQILETASVQSPLVAFLSISKAAPHIGERFA